MINGVILRKLNVLDERLAELRSLIPLTTTQLEEDWRTQRAVERNLQLLVEVVIDVCQRLISLAGQTPVTSGGEAVTGCVQLNILSSEQPYRKMVQLRNFIVHRYEQIDVSILVTMVNRHLGDFEQFKREVQTYVADQSRHQA